MDNPAFSASMALAAYLEPQVEGRRVVVFGDSTSGLAQHLVDRGARLVHVYDADLSRVAEGAARSSSQAISFAPLGQSGVAIRDGAFDVGVIADLSASEEPADLVRRLRRALAPRGVALVASPNPEAQAPLLQEPRSGTLPTYYELYDFVSAEFDEVGMFGQTPFVGYALASFSPEGDPDFSVDTAFLPGGAEEPDYFVAIASHLGVETDPFSIIQLSHEGLLEQVGGGRTEETAPGAEQQLAAVEERARNLEAENARQRQVIERAERLAPNPEVVEQLRQELSQRDGWLTQLEERAATADDRADGAEAELESLKRTLKRREREELARSREAEESRKQLEQNVQRLQNQLAESRSAAQSARAAAAEAQVEPAREPLLETLQEELAQMRERCEQQEARLATQKAGYAAELAELRQELQRRGNRSELERVTERVAELEAELEGTRQDLRALGLETGSLEQHLSERGREVARLTRELARTERLAAELVTQRLASEDVDTESEQTEGQSGELEARLDELARLDAQKGADLAAAQWTIQQLEQQVAQLAGC